MAGVVVNPDTLLEEIDALESRGIEISPERLLISQPSHIWSP